MFPSAQSSNSSSEHCDHCNDQGARCNQRNLLTTLRRNHCVPRCLCAFDVGLFVGDGRLPTQRLQGIVRHHPRPSCVVTKTGRKGATLNDPPDVGEQVGEPTGQANTSRRTRQTTHHVTGNPTVGCHVVDTTHPGRHDHIHRARKIVEMQELCRRIVLAGTQSHAGGERADNRWCSLGCQGQCRPQHANGTSRLLPPALHSLFFQHQVDGRCECVGGTQWR